MISSENNSSRAKEAYEAVRTKLGGIRSDIKSTQESLKKTLKESMNLKLQTEAYDLELAGLKSEIEKLELRNS
jgi:chromosome segregation ATPase